MPEEKTPFLTKHGAGSAKALETPEKQPQRAVIIYRTKEFKEKAKWSLWFQREIGEAKDSVDAMYQFYDRFTWPCMTGAIEVQKVEWPDAEPIEKVS